MTTPAPPVYVTDAAPERLLLHWLRECDCRATDENEERVEKLCRRGEALGLIDRDGKLLDNATAGAVESEHGRQP